MFTREFSRMKDLVINKGEVLRYLGYKAGKRSLNRRVLHMLEQEMEEAGRLLAPRGCFGVFEAAPLRREQIFSDAERVAFGVCTISGALERRVRELFHQREGARGVILDAIGSAAAEEAANLLNKEVLRWGSQRGLRATRRFSPGYGGWPVDGQELIFSCLEGVGEKTGVSLTASRMMIPVKSVSFAVKLGRGRLEEVNKGACGSCTLYGRCSFQHQEGTCTRKISGKE